MSDDNALDVITGKVFAYCSVSNKIKDMARRQATLSILYTAGE